MIPDQSVLIVDENGEFRTRFQVNVPARRRAAPATLICGKVGSVQLVGDVVTVVAGCAGSAPYTTNLVILAANGVSAQNGDTAYVDCRFAPSS